MPEDPILVERRGGISWVTLNRPDKRNAINAEMREQLLAAIAEASNDQTIRCLVLTGAGKGFCTGADLSGSKGGGKPQAGSIRDVIREGTQRVFKALWELEVPTIAAVNGVTAGFGCQLAFACDLVIASEESRFIEVFTSRGIIPDGGSAYLLPRLIGLARAKEMVFFADPWSAADAERIGLVNRVVPPSDLEKVTMEWAERLATGPTKALGLAKRLLNRSLESTLDASLEEEALTQELITNTNDIREGITAFVEKRDPKFTGT
ncbi:MAG TPA: enoyl-CoA hydratase [Actinomycetota bacterium]|nr:enoyl-CoA hydratase [Actinomycetota bacterium]